MDGTLIVVLIALAALLGLAGWLLIRLRRDAPALNRRRAALGARAHQLSQEFSGLARRQPAAPGEPYASRLARIATQVRKDWEQARQVESDLRRPAVEPLARPAWHLALIAPLLLELFARAQAWLFLTRRERQTRQVEQDLAEVRRQLEEMARLGSREQAALSQVQNQTRALKEELSEQTWAGALSAEREKLSALAGQLEEAAQGLKASGQEEPAPEKVVEVYQIRLQAEKELETIRQSRQSHESQRKKLQPRLERQREKFNAFEAALAAEENLRPAPLLKEKAAAVGRLLADLQEKLACGEYTAVESGLADLIARQKESEETLKKLVSLRSRLAGVQQQTEQSLVELREWMRQFTPPYEMDIAQEQIQALQSKLQEQSRAAASEDLEALEKACQVSVDTIRKSQNSFERSLSTYERLAEQVTPEVIEGMQKRAEHLSSRLKLRHTIYQEKARLAQLEEHISALAQSWVRVQAADPTRQSGMLQLGEALQQLDAAWGNLERDTRRAFETLELAKQQQEQAQIRLQHEAFVDLPAMAQLEGTEWAQAANRLLGLHRPLVERAARGDENYETIQNEAEALQKDSARLAKEYQARLGRLQTETDRLVAALNDCADRLERLIQHPYLAFEDRSSPILNEVRRWLGQAQIPALSGLDRWSKLADQGERLRQEADALCREMEGEAATGDQDRAWTDDMLVTAEEYLGSARQQQPAHSFNGELAAARNLLETARRKLDVLNNPRQKYDLDEFQAQLGDVRDMISGARAHIERVLK